MLQQGVFKIRVSRDYLKNKCKASPKVKFENSFTEISLEEYFKSMTELAYKILKEEGSCSIE